MMGVAAGMALSGFRPIVYTITPFVTMRCLEQIRVDVCYHNAPVVIVGVGSGLAYASLGPTHHSCEDIACLRSLPNLKVVCPADPWEVRAALRAALLQTAPVYIRLGKKGEAALHGGTPPAFEIGKSLILREGHRVALLATGNIVAEAGEVAEQLEGAGISARLASVHTVKPLDEAFLASCFRDFELVVTIEEHGRIGGFGSAVAEWLADHGGRARLLRFGTGDYFLKQSGEQHFSRETYGITADQMSERIIGSLGKAGRA